MFHFLEDPCIAEAKKQGVVIIKEQFGGYRCGTGRGAISCSLIGSEAVLTTTCKYRDVGYLEPLLPGIAVILLVIFTWKKVD